jgi:hypothetical protein
VEEVVRKKKEFRGEGVDREKPSVPNLYSLRDRKILLATRTDVVGNPFDELVVAGGEDIIQRGSMTNGDT